MSRLSFWCFILLPLLVQCRPATPEAKVTHPADIQVSPPSDTLRATSTDDSAATLSDNAGGHSGDPTNEPDDEFRQKATISRADSLIQLTANMRLDHRIFGYARPDTNAQKMILLCIFTDEVAGNPYHYPYGAYYETSGMGNRSLKYLSPAGDFIAAAVMDAGLVQDTVFMLRKWVEFED